MDDKEIIKNKKPAANKVLPKAGLNGFDWAFEQSSTAVILLNFSAKIPRLRQYPNRCTPFFDNPQFQISSLIFSCRQKLAITFNIILSVYKNYNTTLEN